MAVAAAVAELGATLRSRGWLDGGGRPADARHGVRLSAVVIVLTAALSSSFATAQSSSASYQVPRQSIDGGRSRVSSASYAVEGTIGQPDAAPAIASASYELRGGFHLAAAAVLPDPVFSSGFE